MKWEKIATSVYALHFENFSILYFEAHEIDAPARTSINLYTCFYTLKGDHRSQYEELAKEGVDACLEYWAKEKGKKGK